MLYTVKDKCNLKPKEVAVEVLALLVGVALTSLLNTLRPTFLQLLLLFTGSLTSNRTKLYIKPVAVHLTSNLVLSYFYFFYSIIGPDFVA